MHKAQKNETPWGNKESLELQTNREGRSEEGPADPLSYARTVIQ